MHSRFLNCVQSRNAFGTRRFLWRNGIVSERTGCDVSVVKPESRFSELGIDSLDTVELLMNLEDELGIEIELDQKVETVDDLDRFIQSKKG